MKTIHGLIGKVSFYISIPALLYLFVIQAFSGKRPVRMRSICLIVFVLLCGCTSQIFMQPTVLPQGLAVLSALFDGGATGATAGVLCGGLALILQLLCGKVISAIVFIVAAILTLLAAMQITIPSIIRAIQNRPRPEWEDEELEERQEPAAVVVNHLAKKHIEHVEQKRARKNEQMQIDIDLDEPVVPTNQSKRKPTREATDMMRQIDVDVDSPVAAAGNTVSADANVDLIMDADKKPAKKVNTMPVLEVEPDEAPFIEDDVPAAPPVADVKIEKVTAKDASESAAQVAAEIEQAQAQEKPEYCFPPIDLLASPTRGMLDGTTEMRENSRRLNETLASFKIEAHIINVTRGPSVTRYEVELDKGVRLNKLTTCANDIALSLGVSNVRIAAVPGKISVVGIEVPNKAVTTVSLREVIDSNEFCRAKSKSSFAVGKDIGGSCIVGNISKLPHMLIAGTTGSGKSVCMNSIIISLLYKASPDDVKLIMVDPKMVELGIYNGIPHLLIPVVTDPKKAAGSLQWAVTEMMRRYKSMSDAGVRDLESYNSIIETQEIEGVKLPHVVVIIDELADLMLVAAKEVEESICRIAQMGRAAGIHLVIATQRPSADVITGLMKANIPSRIAFAVASAMESRIILDTPGAEKLVGRGDMLFAPIGAGKPLRVQGCFVSDEEVEAVASYVKNNYVTNYDQTVMDEIERKAAQTGNNKAAATAADPEPNSDELDGDEMLPAAVDVILETGQASVSMLQRRLKLGYARAARIVDEMEQKGIVGPFQGSKPRTILVTKEQWEQMKSGQPAQMDFDDLEEEDDEVPEELM
ncbi:MAG: DNA translocase FtsK [Oscillospiraceae bacterium]|nr:DNA translocase FtsK [Oscillospiraceae bacterium]